MKQLSTKSKALSRKELLLLLLPIICGMLFVTAVFLNQLFFKNQIISTRQAIGYEFIFFLLGFIVTAIQLAFATKCLFNKQWKLVFLCLSSTLLFWAMIIFGRSQGAALFYAT